MGTTHSGLIKDKYVLKINYEKNDVRYTGPEILIEHEESPDPEITIDGIKFTLKYRIEGELYKYM